MTSPAAPSLDLFTVKAMTLITVLVVSCATFFASSINRRVVGIRQFAAGLMLFALGGVLGIARVLISGDVILVFCNAFMVGGLMTAVQGIRIFRGFRSLSRSQVAAIALVISAFYFYWLFGRDQLSMRVGVISAAFAVLSIDAAASMFRHVSAPNRVVYWPTGFAFAFAALYLCVRAFSGFSGKYGSSAFAPVPVEMASTICANIAYIGCAFGMLVASNAQLRLEAEKKALIDPLTSLPNRRLFWDRLMEAEDRARATRRKFGLIYFDLDGFKQVNDKLGHDVGDELLRRVSKAMARTLRLVDCLGRIGGDEFVVLVEDVDTHEAVGVLARRLQAAVEREPVPANAAGSIRISYGIALFPDDGRHAHDALREADAAMYLAKQEGREKQEGGEKQYDRARQSAMPVDPVVSNDLRNLDENIAAPPDAVPGVAEVVPQRRRSDRKPESLPQSVSGKAAERESGKRQVSWASRFLG